MGMVIDAADLWLNTGSTVFIASEDLLARWSSRAATPTDLLAFADADAQHALDVIERRPPRAVVLEQLFASSARGAAFVRHLRAIPALAGLDIRTLSSERAAGLATGGPANGGMLAGMADPLQVGPVRRARRLRMPDGAEVLVDGTRTALIDLSTFGAQVVSETILRPKQSVRVMLNRDGMVMQVAAAIAWSAVELLSATHTYRAGLEFADEQTRTLLEAGSY